MRSTRPLGCSKMRLRKLGRSRERRARQPAGRRSLVAAAVRAFSSHMPARRLRARRKGRSDSVTGRRFLPALSRDTSFGSSSAGTEPLARPWLGNSSSRDVFRRLRCCDGLRALTTARSRLACARAHQEFLVFLSVASQKLLFALSRVNPNHFKLFLFLFFTFF